MERKQAMTKGLVTEVSKLALENKSLLWKNVVRGLSRPGRKEHKVNLFKIDKLAKAKEVLVVPGSVLGSGEISKPVTVAALKFSARAREMIEKAGGSCMTIRELVEKNPKGDRVRIVR